MKLSMSNPVAWARPKSDGGFQYAGTKSGSVTARSEVHALTTSISCRLSGLFRASVDQPPDAEEEKAP